MSNKNDVPRWDDTELIEDDMPSWEDTEFIDDSTSQLETLGRSAAQGLTLGFGEELGAAALTPLEVLRAKISKLIPGTPEHTDAQLRAQGFTGDIEEKGIGETYSDLRDTSRKADKVAEEANPLTYMTGELIGGIAPAIVSGGGAAAAGVAKSLGKQGLKQASKEAAKVGAKYGAASGAGYSEADVLEGEVGQLASDVGVGTAFGAGLGALTPAAAAGAKALAGKTKRGLQSTLETLIPESEAIKAGYKYGKQGKKITQDVLDNDAKDIAKNILKNIKKDKKNNNLESVKEKLDALGYNVDTKKTINKAIEDIEKLTKKDYLDLQNKELLPKIKQLAGINAQEAAMAEKARKQVLKKAIESEGKGSQALIKAEKDIAKIQEMNNLKINNAPDDIAKMTEDIGGTIGEEGTLLGKKANFETPDGEEFTKKFLSDATPYKPEVSKILGPDGRPIIKTTDLGSGKVTAMVGDIEEKISLNLKNMSISEVETLRTQLNLATDLAKAQGASDDPIMRRAQKLAGELKELTDEAVAKSGDRDLINKRARFSDIFSAEEMLGIDQRLAPRGDIDEFKKALSIGDKLAFEKGFTTRQESEMAEKLLGKKVVTPEMKEQLKLLRKLNQVSGRESQENVSRAGLYKMAVGDVPNIVGRAVKAVDSVTISPVKKVVDSINKMGTEQVNKIAADMSRNNNKGIQYFGNQLMNAMQLEGPAKVQAMWSLSQQPAFREYFNQQESPANYIEQFDTNMKEDLGLPVENNRTPSSIDSIEEGLEHIIELEAGYQAQKEDTGNFLDGKLIGTNMGITPKAYKSFYGEAPSIDDMKNLTKEQAVEIYKEDYINKPKFDKIVDPNLKLALVDFGINSGPSRAVKTLQEIVGAKSDGKIGPKTLKKIEDYKGDLTQDFIEARRGFIKGLNNPKYEKGWLNRIAKIEELTSSNEPSPKKEIDVNALLQEYAARDPELEDGGIISEEDVQEAERAVDRVNQQQSSGDTIPENHYEALLGKIAQLQLKEEDQNELEDAAINMTGYSDGAKLKELLRKVANIKQE